MSAVIDRLKLRSICDLLSPRLPATKLFRSGRPPKHRCSLIGDRTNEVPLSAAKAPRTRAQRDELIGMLCATAKPSCFGIAQVGRDHCDCSAAAPLDRGRSGAQPRSHRSLPNEEVQVQLQSILQANPQAMAWHGQLFRLRMSSGRQDWPKRFPGPKVPRNHLAPWAGPLKPFLAPSVRGLGSKGQSTWRHPLLGPGLSCQKAFPRAFSPATCSDRHDPQ
jgi:hypothetical protein